MTDARQTEKTYGQWWESSEEQVTVRLSAVENVGMAALRRGRSVGGGRRFSPQHGSSQGAPG